VEGVLAESQRTNIKDYPRFGNVSDGETDAYGGKYGTGRTGIDGTNNAVELYKSDSGGDRIRRLENIPDDSTGWTASFFLKKNQGGSFKFRIRPKGGNDIDLQAAIDPSDGSFTPASEEGEIEIRDFGNWWRVIFTVNNNGTGNTRTEFRWQNMTGGEGDGIIVDAVQLENHHAVATDANGYADATHATMPILTGGATRSEDRLVMPVWWDNSGISGGYVEARQEAGDEFGYSTGGNYNRASLNIGAGTGRDDALFAYNWSLGDGNNRDGTNYESGARYADDWVTLAINTNDTDGGDIRRLYVLPDKGPSDVHGATFILRRLYLWPQELTEGSGGQLESLFNHDFSV